MFKLYRVNEALIPGKGAYTLVQEFPANEEQAVRNRVRTGNLENLRSFVRFEIHRPDGTREEIARGMAR